MFEEYSEKNHSELPPLTIIQGGGTIRRDESDRALQYDMNSLSNYKMVNKDDFIVHLRSFEGGLEKANSKGIISPAYHTFSGENTDATFYYTYFRSEKFIESDLKPHVYGIRDGRSIDVEGMKSINIPYTIFEEQRHIGYLIDSINHLITLHQSKSFGYILEAIVSYTLYWEQRKVNEIIEDYIEKTTIQNQYTVLTSSQQKGIVYQEEYFSDRQVTTNANIGYYVLPRGYFTYRSRSDTNVFVFNRNDIIDKGIISYYYPVFFNKNSDSNFLLRRLNTGIERQIIMAAEGTGQHVLAHSKFKNMDIFVPYLDEQKRIGKYFESLDHLITLHQLEPFQLIFKAIAYRIIDYTKSKPPRCR